MPIPDGAWRHISMDFIVGLPWSNGYNAILVVVCRLTKMRHFIPCRDTCTAEQLADLYARHIFRIHGMPKTVVSDRGTQFIAKFWKALCKILRIEVLLSTPYHPETDGQTERINAILEQYLRAYINYLQDDWEAWLHMAEFAANNQASETTGMSPFFATYGQDPLWQFDFTAVEEPRLPEEERAQQVSVKMKEITDHLQAEILRAQHRQQEYADGKRRPAPAFRVGDKVWLNAQNIATQRPSRKLDHRRIGPYEIIKVVSPYAYKLQFPASIKYHPVQHVSLLDPFDDDPLPGQHNPPPPPVIVDDNEEWHVEEILDSRLYRRRLQYLVKWIGFDRPDWEPAEGVNKLEAVDRFHERYPDKPGPLPEDN
jgi:hypothetical protein